MSRGIAYTDVDEAIEKLVGEIKIKPDIEIVKLREAYKRVAAEDVTSPFDLPPYDVSHVDGYAVRSEDTTSASESSPAYLTLKRGIGPGEVPKGFLGRGEAYKVATGGFLPLGADAVLMKEKVSVEDGKIKVLFPEKPGSEVTKAGSDVRKGEVVVKRGRSLKAQDIGLLASLRVKEVKAFRRPIVAIMAVGSELTDVERPELEKVVNSHGLVISKLVEEAGGEPLDMGIIRDDAVKLREMIEISLRRASLVLTIGGSSVGEADLVEGVVNSIGKPGILVHGLKLQPGRVAGFGVVDGKPIFLLPGLIQSTVNSFVFLVYPAIQILLGRSPTRHASIIPARISEEVKFHGFQSFRKVTWVKLARTSSGFEAAPILGHSPMMNVLAKADGYVVLPESDSRIPKGKLVDVHLVPGIATVDGLP